ncbi:MAG: serine/threonine protein kinase [Myxococcales bacterium]|nr:serine/threonine protein kinase [Myxococcales bacterium]
MFSRRRPGAAPRARVRPREAIVVDITDFGYTKRGQAFLVMEYLDGEDLSETLRREGRLAWQRVCHVVAQVASALEAAHARGVIHRDIKPENFFRITRHRDQDFIKVLDFGIAKLTSDALDGDASASMSSAGLVGTPEYIAPELLAGAEADVRVDIYAIGVVMYQLLTGVTPFSGTTLMEILSQSALDDATPPRERVPEAQIPERIEAIVMRAIAREPEERFQSAAALREAIEAAMEDDAETTVVGALTQAGRGRWLALLFAAVVLLVVAGLAITRAGAPEHADERVAASAATTEEATAEPTTDSLAADADAIASPVATPDLGARDDDHVRDHAGSTTDGGALPEADADDGAGEEEGEDERTSSATRRPASLSPAAFRRKIKQSTSRIRRKCGALGIKGMKVTVEVQVAASGRVTQVIPRGTMAGSSLGDCVSRAVKSTRFKPARRSSVHTTILSI